MAAAENVHCNLSVEEEIHGEWILDSMSDMVYYLVDISLISFEAVEISIQLENRLCVPLKTTKPDTDIANKRYYCGMVRKSTGKKYMKLST